MTYYDASYTGLPDPEMEARFYENVPTRRFVAWIFDGLIVFAITVLVGIITFGIAIIFLPLTWLVLGLIYRTVTISSGSATYGMRMVGIEFRNKRGEKLSTGVSFANTALYTIFSGTMLLQLLSIGLILGSRYGQSLPDMILGTTVINRPVN